MVAREREAELADTRTIEATVIASRALLGVIARSMAASLEVVTLPQFRVLVVLSTSEPVRMGELAERMRTLPSTFSRWIDRMVAAGWVQRTTSPDSRREILIALTPDGRDLVDDVTDRRRQNIATMLATMTPDNQQAVRIGFEAFAAAAGETTIEDLLTLGI